MRQYLVLTLCAGLAGVSLAQQLSPDAISNQRIKYVPSAQLKEHPVPAVVFKRSGLATDKQREEVLEKIVYPLVNSSNRAIAAVVIEFPRENRKWILMTVTVIWSEGGYHGSVIERNADGSFDSEAYRRFLRPDEGGPEVDGK